MKFHSKFSASIVLKWTGILFLLAAYLASSIFITILPVSAITRRAIRVRNTSFFSALALMVFGVRVHAKNEGTLNGPKGCLVVSNHVSYIDILVISSIMPSVFVTSVELKNTRLLGILARFGGSLFVERRKRSGLKQEIGAIAKVLKQGFTVILFPEGTTYDGACVRDFKNSLFQSAISAGADVLPVCLRYRTINQKPVANDNKDTIYYYGGVPFSKHFPGFMSLSSVDVEVVPLKKITVGPDTSRKELAEQAHSSISIEYQSGNLPGDTRFTGKEGV